MGGGAEGPFTHTWLLNFQCVNSMAGGHRSLGPRFLEAWPVRPCPPPRAGSALLGSASPWKVINMVSPGTMCMLIALTQPLEKGTVQTETFQRAQASCTGFLHRQQPCR